MPATPSLAFMLKTRGPYLAFPLREAWVSLPGHARSARPQPRLIEDFFGKMLARISREL